jgi:hypothetical protein
MFRMHANSVCGHPDETPRLFWTKQRRDTKGWDARHVRERLRARHYFARFRG